jgi:hypothetical protein
VQLQAAKKQFHKEGLGLAAISYDSQAILQDFSERHKIDFALLSDPDSEIIRQYGVLNAEATGFTKGMAYPGYFYVTPDLRVREKFFETAYTDRYTASNLVLKIFPELVEGNGRDVAAPHMKLTLSQSDDIVVPGSRFTMIVDSELPSGTHVYAPGVKGYKPIQLLLDPSPELKLEDVRYPQPRVLYLPVIKESVPVYEGRFRIVQDVVLSADRNFRASIGSGKPLTVKGTLLYQACDESICYLPQKLPVSWDIHVAPLDATRSPGSIQHK